MKIKAEENALRHLAKIADGDARKALNARWKLPRSQRRDKKGGRSHDLAAAEQSIQKRPLCMTTKTRITTRFPRSSNPCVQRPGRRALLAGQNDSRRRRPPLHRAADCESARRKTWAWRIRWPWCWPTRRCRWRNLWLAGGTHTTGRGDGLYRHRQQEQTALTRRLTRASKDVRSGRTLAGAGTFARHALQGAERLGHGKGYEYAHDHPGHFVAQGLSRRGQALLRTDRTGRGKKIKERVEKWRAEIYKIKQTKLDHG